MYSYLVLSLPAYLQEYDEKLGFFYEIMVHDSGISPKYHLGDPIQMGNEVVHP